MRKSRQFALVVMLISLIVIASPLRAEVKLPAVIGDNMVLQQGMEIPIWGWADPGEKVQVIGDWQSRSWQTTTDSDGKWMVRIDPPKVGGPYTIIIKGENTIKLANILCGEVWVCSGQSNMAMSVAISNNAQEEIEAADFPKIRLFTVARKTSTKPLDDCKGSWSMCEAETVRNFSGVAYFFGRELHRELDVPVGLIHTSWGGTPAEAWTRLEVLDSDADFKPIISNHNERWINYLEEIKKYNQEMADWYQVAEQAHNKGNDIPSEPVKSKGPDRSDGPAKLYNSMIAPVIPYAIKGVIWYQGESNSGRAWQYRKLFPAMIRNWRRDWAQGEFPFLYVQIAPYQGYGKRGQSCPELQEAQLMTLSVPNTGMAVTTDIGNIKDIHPRNKQDVGKRLALWAFAKTYGQDVVYSGPLYKSMKVEGDKIRLGFNHTAGKLVARDGSLTDFIIAGADKQFVPAQAVIDGESVVVRSDKVSKPVAVRFAWRNDAEPNFFNKAGLPASPFRTDDWPGETFERR